MNARKLITPAVLACALLLAGTGVAQADPAQPTPGVQASRQVLPDPGPAAAARAGSMADDRLRPVASTEEDRLAQQAFMGNLNLATQVGGLVGTIAGGVLGLGGLLLGGVGVLMTVPLLAAVGGIVGTIVAGGPTLVASGVDYLQTLQAAPGTSRFQAEIDRARNAQNAPRR